MASRDNVKNLRNNRPGLFSSTITRGLKQGPSAGKASFKRSENDLVSTDISSTSSFKYSLDGDGLKSTQQLNVDYSDFANHTFFNSAQVKTNVAFDIIFNGFPFDGTKQEYESFFEALTGFEKWVYDQFPKNKGYMYFAASGSTTGPYVDEQTYVTVVDRAGAAYPSVSKIVTGENILNPGSNSMTLELQLFVPTMISSSASMILDKHSESAGVRNGYSLVLNPTGSSVSSSVTFYAMSGSVYDAVTVEVKKGQFNHIAFVWDRTPGIETIFGYVNQELLASSSQPVEFGFIDASTANLYIGSGSAISGLFTPTLTFSGAIDELRIWHKVRTDNDRNLYKEKNVFAQDGLKAYYKFNEPSGSNSSVVLDYSGNSLHGKLSTGGILLGVREVPTSSIAGASPMIWERIVDNPILFPSYPDILDLQSKLLTSASLFDQANPNIITRLIPPHYLAEGQVEEGLETETGFITEQIQGGNDPRSFALGATQTLLLLLYTWAKFFDEMKLYIQTISTLRTVDYDLEDTVPDQFLLDLARNEGIELPPLFNGSSIEQFIEGENIQSDISNNDITLQNVRNQIWRRILINLQDVLKSKGTIHSVKSFIRAVGIDPDNNFRIREFGGPTSRALTFAREKRSEITTMLAFPSMSNGSGGALLLSPYLSSSRVEIGYPYIGSNNDTVGLLTSGSFTLEGTYKFVPGTFSQNSQSLMRLQTTGSQASAQTGLALNVVAVSSSNTVTLFVRSDIAGNDSTLAVPVTGVDIFDGSPWYVSVGRQRADDGLNSLVSASYFVRIAKQNYGEIIQSYNTSSMHFDGAGGSVWCITSSQVNSTGAYVAIGSQSISLGGNVELLNSTIYAPEVSRYTSFEGRITQFRFWSKYLTEQEWPEHVRNFRSVGVEDPLTNFNFTTTPTGSFQRLRIDASTDQIVTESNGSGEVFLTDFTQNGFTLTGSGFPFTSSVIVPERFFYSYLSPKFDESATTDKVRVRGFSEFANVEETPWASVSPVYDIERSELPTDNTRFTIDFSVVDALNQDIVTIFSSLKALDNILGNPEMMFSPDYPGLDDLRQIYFNKLTDKMNLRLFFDFFKWFDTNIGTFVAQLLPRKTRFLGTNFVVESHMLERPRVEYQFSDIYLGDNTRHSLKDTILLQLITGEFKRY